jgi:hypothetical protein
MKFGPWYALYFIMLVSMYGMARQGDDWAVGWCFLLFIQPFVLDRNKS